MTTKEFLTYLAATRPRYRWQFGHWADEPIVQPIRARQPGGHCYCPITAVAKRLTRKRYSLGDFGEAAAAIGLSPQVAHRIAAAADNENCAYPNLRAKLLKTLGLD